MKKSLKVAAAGVITALSVILLQLGSLIWLFAYLMPLISGLIMIILTESGGKKSAWLVYAAVSIIAMLLLEDKECVLIYVLFFGYYPIIRDSINKIKLKAVRIISKLLIFNSGIVAAELICIYVFGIPFDDFLGKWGAVILLALANVMFFVYERLLGMVIILYNKKYKSKIERYLK